MCTLRFFEQVFNCGKIAKNAKNRTKWQNELILLLKLPQKPKIAEIGAYRALGVRMMPGFFCFKL